MPQVPDVVPGETVKANIERRIGLAEAEVQLRSASDQLASGEPAADAYDAALQRFLSLGAGDFAGRARGALNDAGLNDVALDDPVMALSGGQSARLRLASIMLMRADVCLLDEPTSDLDFPGLFALERFVKGYDGAIVAVSHDRTFLDSTVTQILELDRDRGRSSMFSGNWSAYLTAREQERTRAYERHDRYIDKQAALHEAQQRQQTVARSGERATNRRLTASLASRTKAIQRRLDRLEAVEKPWEPWRLQLSLVAGSRSGDLVVSFREAEVSLAGMTLGPFDLEVRRGDRILVTGRNGAGKSTLLCACSGELSVQRGTRTVGSGVTIGYLDQARSGLTMTVPLIDSFLRITATTAEQARSLLAKFDLDEDDVGRPPARLSPGERTRAILAMCVARGVNLLLLDEPLNHLDLPAIEQLEQALDKYDGTVMLVSHDRALIASFRHTHALTIQRVGDHSSVLARPDAPA
jgi:ATPase subunit of ABC transporter with duplicated ATPase domains